LMEIADLTLNRPPTAAEVAFRLAPRINAAGRMDVATDVVELFLTRDPVRAQTLAGKLDALNRSRRETETDALASIDQHLATLITPAGEYPPECLILDHPGWHRGVLGILASRVVERTHRPVLVVTHADGVAHGSGRSIPGFHLLDALTAAEGAEPGEGLFQRFGGHAHAVGFSLPSSRLAELRARISVHAARWLTGDVLTPVLHYDAELSLDQIAPELFAWVERLAPFGLGNPEPVFLIRNAILGAPPRAIKSRHVCLEFRVPTIHEPDSGPGPRDVAASRAVIHALGWSNGSTAAGSAGASSWAARCSAMGLVTGSAVDLLVRLRQKTGPYANERLGGMELELQDLRVALPVATGEL
jgi:single-stranded-DNA-specific exonuclease